MGLYMRGKHQPRSPMSGGGEPRFIEIRSNRPVSPQVG